MLLLIAAACVAGFVRLGFWQLHRAQDKEAQLARGHAVLSERRLEPLAGLVDAPDPDNAADATLHWSGGAGHFLPLAPVLLDNQMHDSRPGVRVYRVFQPDAARRAVLVDLGWRPLGSARTTLPEPLPSGARDLRGLFAMPPASGLRMGAAAPQRQPGGALLAMRIEPARIASELGVRNGVAARVLRLDPALPIGYARDLDVLGGAMPPERHRGYAVQWFAMAAGLAVASLVVALRRPHRTEPVA